MAYAEYDFYTNEYFGTAVSPEAFSKLAERATAYIRAVTSKRSDSASGGALKAVKLAMCELVDIMQDESKMNSRTYGADRIVTSETVGSWSRSFGSASASGTEIDLVGARKQEALQIYLGPYGLLQMRGYRR